MKQSLKYATLQPGKHYHVFTRGNNKETLFKASENYAYFLQLWKKYILPVAETYAYCLMSNHFHFCIRIRPESQLAERYVSGERHLSQPFSNCFNAYAKTINSHYGRTGSLFEEKYKRKEVTSENYFLQLITYIHGNPQFHGFCDDFREYPYSSYFKLIDESMPTFLLRDELWDRFGSKDEFIEMHEGILNLTGV